MFENRKLTAIIQPHEVVDAQTTKVCDIPAGSTVKRANGELIVTPPAGQPFSLWADVTDYGDIELGTIDAD